MMDKKSIREQVKSYRQQMPELEISKKSRIIVDKLIDCEEYLNTPSIYTYVSFNQEVETKELIERSLAVGKQVYVPKIHKNPVRMIFHRIQSLDELVPGTLGILEPDNDFIDEKREGLMIMPGVAFDRQCNRIGYGGGFYDRYLSQPNSHYKIALSFEFQIYPDLETELFDIKADKIITELNVYESQIDTCF